MNTFYRSLAAGLLVFACCLNSVANNQAYEQRRTDYINQALANVNSDALTLQAYQHVPLDSALLHTMVNNVASGTTVDFDIVRLVRILFFTNGAYDTLILPALNSVPYWLTKNETQRTYWSENHMIMWMSSDWLLHERYGRVIDSTLDRRLRHYLRLKIQFGYYEFFSSVYAPYTLSGLLNLADFSQDAEIKNLAAQAARRLLKDMLMLTNDKGTYFPAAGRNYYGKYETPYGQNHSNLIYLVSGLAPLPGGASHAGGFLASSTLQVDSVTDSWVPNLDTVYTVGHSMDTGFVLNSAQSHIDRIIFQWSAGEYFHPAVAYESAQLIIDSNLWNHVDFAPFHSLSSVTLSSVPALSQQLSVASKSTVNVGEEVVIYKHGSITLSSIRNFWPGKLGYQQIPCVANVGTTAVLTASGAIHLPWHDRPESNDNEHLPYVLQHKNIALVMYRPEPKPALLNYHNPEVALFFQDADYDEVRSDSTWTLGRQGTNYVAVRRSCGGQMSGIPACDIPNGQTWVIMVGDSGLYGSFDHFDTLTKQAQFEEQWYFDSTSQSVYYAKIVIDTATLEYAWRVDTTTETGITPVINSTAFNVYPNPANNAFTVKVNNTVQPLSIKVSDLFGRIVYAEKWAGPMLQKNMDAYNWAEGIYIITVETPQGNFSTKLVKRN